MLAILLLFVFKSVIGGTKDGCSDHILTYIDVKLVLILNKTKACRNGV